jgi:predicted CXXCH cytochrome family protein
MKKTGFIILLGLFVVLFYRGTPQAFHSGGVAECSGCHSMHSPAATGTSLLKNSDQSSTCLSCHLHAGDTAPNGYHVATADADMPKGKAPLQRTPGGDFGWLKKTYDTVIRGTAYHEAGDTHGHNIVAGDFGFLADPTNTTAPGGTFASAQLACNSCHDPHGSYRRRSDGTIGTTGGAIIASGSYKTSTTPGYSDPPTTGNALGVYRLLAGLGYKQGITTVGYGGVPAAKVPNTYNQKEDVNQVRAAYGVATTGGHVTWSNWCATCHPNMHSSGHYVHPVDQALGSTIIANYNSYVKSGDMTGVAASSFTSLVPFASNTSDYSALAGLANNGSPTGAGPSNGDQVTCLSCHRAHASGFPEMLRFNTEGEFMIYNGLYPGDDTTPTVPQFALGRQSVETQAAYYDRPVTTFATYQRVLCNKCHAKD